MTMANRVRKTINRRLEELHDGAIAIVRALITISIHTIMMMSMYMLGAMDKLSKLTLEAVKVIAMEIAMRGVQGISPSKESGYSIPSLPGKDFSGYQFLAYYYVSWAIAFPEKVGILGLPFKDAYETALGMFKTKGGKYPQL